MGDIHSGDQADSEAALEAPTWFQGQVRYEGYGRAEFKEPHGFVEGPTRVEFDETGVARGQMHVAHLTADEDLPLGAFQLFHADRPVPTEEGLSLTIGIDSKFNDCVGLAVETPDGVFAARSPIGYSHTQSWSINQPEQLSLKFQLFRGTFVIDNVRPTYWVLPLTNFISSYRPSPNAFAAHPLRFRRIPPAQDRLIAFEYKALPAYIETLIDHEEREKRLEDGFARRLVTAVAVGELPGETQSDEQIERFLPRDLLMLLSVATGSEVGAPWIELRDENGELLARMHSHRGRPTFAKGHRAIDERIHAGTGALLTQGAKSAIYGSPTLRVTANLLVRAGQRNLMIDDQFSLLCRALDSLCRNQGINAKVNATSLLGDAEAVALKQILKNTRKELRQLASAAKREGNEEAAAALQQVDERIPGALDLERGFGRNVVELINRYGFPDLAIVETFLQANPRPDKRKWPAMLSYYRGMVMHSGYLDSSKEPAGRGIETLADHLHDVLLRILFKMLDYPGNYQPAVINWRTDSPVDWVTADTPPHRLGYE